MEHENLTSDGVFIVTKEGVYRHDIVGVFYREDAARVAAENAAKLEPDDYHAFQVTRMEIARGPEHPVATLRRHDARRIENGRYVIEGTTYEWEPYE